MQTARRMTPDPQIDGLTLSAILRSALQIRPNDIALRSYATGPDARPDAISHSELDRRVVRLATFLGAIKAPENSNVIIVAPFSAEAVVASLAAMRAGLTPTLVSPSATATDLARLIDLAGAPIAIGVDKVGDLRPLENLRQAAARSFHLRLLAGFGLETPDGVASLDTIIGHQALSASVDPQARARILVMGVFGSTPDVTIDDTMLVDASLEVARALRPLPGSRIVTTLVGSDLASWATGFGAGSLAGLEVAPMGLFSLGKLWASLSDGVPVHLVIPASVEPALVQSGLARNKALASLVLVHSGRRPPRDAEVTGLGGPTIIDVERLAPDRIAVARR